MVKPEERPESIPKELQRSEQMLSNQAQDTLRRAGFSSNFIDQVKIMLTDATAVNREDMPQKLEGWSRVDKGKLIPDISAYAPDIKARRRTYNAFASNEGQRFMKDYYGRLRRNEKGEWIMGPEKFAKRRTAVAKLGGLVPKRRKL